MVGSYPNLKLWLVFANEDNLQAAPCLLLLNVLNVLPKGALNPAAQMISSSQVLWKFYKPNGQNCFGITIIGASMFCGSRLLGVGDDFFLLSFFPFFFFGAAIH